MKIESGDFVMPGDALGIIEQYLPGDGTYDEEGYIKSSVLGNVNIDFKNRKINVDAKTGSPVLLKLGDIVYGQVTDVRGQRALIDIQGKKDETRQLAIPYLGAIHISQVKNGFLDWLTDALRIGDIIEAKVSRITGDNIDLNTTADDCGIVKAMCSRCRSYLKTTNKGNELYCENCDRTEKRKISTNYID